MNPSSETKPSASPFSSRLLSYPLLDWLVFLFDLYRYLRRFISRQALVGMYEILDYDSTLELLDPQGKTAIFKRRQRVKFLQDNIIAFQDYAWGDGEIFSNYQCSPGQVVDRYQQGDRWNILISLRETKSVGDTEDFYIERMVKDGFTKAEEWWQIEIRHHTKRLRLAAIFPKDRRCHRAVLVQRSRNRTTVLGQVHFTKLPDGRQILTWETSQIRRLEVYTLKWQW